MRSMLSLGKKSLIATNGRRDGGRDGKTGAVIEWTLGCYDTRVLPLCIASALGKEEHLAFLAQL